MRARNLRYGATVALLGLSLLTCEARLADSDEPVRKKRCTAVNAARVFDGEGNPIQMVVDQEGDFTKLCWCLTREEADAMREEVNDAAYKVCLENAAAMGYADANDCEYWHSIEHWSGGGFRVWDEFKDDKCDEEPQAGCGVQ